MKSFSLLLLRMGTGLLLVVWGLIKAMAPTVAIHVSDKYYQGVLSIHALQLPLGMTEVILGVLVVLGLWRALVLPIQIAVFGASLLAIWQYVLDPFGLYLVSADAREPLFFPSLTVFAASCVEAVFRGEDKFALDALFARRRSSIGGIAP